MIRQAGYTPVHTGYLLALSDANLGSTEGDMGHTTAIETPDVDMEQGGGDPVDPHSSSGGTSGSSSDDDSKFFPLLKLEC